MVNPGHASKGCTTCKLRRIRCDYGRPFCLQCTKSKRICLGYDFQAKISHNKPGHQNAALMLHPLAATCQLTGLCPLPGLSLSKADDSAAQSCIVAPLVWDKFDRQSRVDREHLRMMVWSMLGTLSIAFYSLQQSVQTKEARKELLQRYGSATRQLREALTIWPCSSALLIPVFHFSLYEMIVNLDPADKTWQTHLSGLLSILQQIPDNNIRFTLVKAVRISDSVTNIHKALESSTVDGLQRACLLLDIIKLQLRKLDADLDAITSSSPRPLRKLDMQKLQVSMKRIRKHLDIFPLMICDRFSSTTVHIGQSGFYPVSQTDKRSQNNFTDDAFMIQWIQFYTLQIMTSAVLLKIGSFLHPDATYQGKREFKALSHIIQEAGEGICSITASYIGLCSQTARDRLEMSKIKTTQAFLLIWPLFCVSTAPGLTDGQQSWAREVLWAIGEQLSIPKALSLACSSGETIGQSDILAGILLVNLLSVLPNPTFI
ncbi:uncharacterized protein TrAtP1_009198 [Trichoderma atroviride]|uniref:uncharacterized protein n=1 Tax=Hypocrea atroviridis TaxID=63577 RepID=UPI00331EB000|nr:hypothetical protein TrAtP1_009198 [Trichoderma atroviride]